MHATWLREFCDVSSAENAIVTSSPLPPNTIAIHMTLVALEARQPASGTVLFTPDRASQCRYGILAIVKADP